MDIKELRKRIKNSNDIEITVGDWVFVKRTKSMLGDRVSVRNTWDPVKGFKGSEKEGIDFFLKKVRYLRDFAKKKGGSFQMKINDKS